MKHRLTVGRIFACLCGCENWLFSAACACGWRMKPTWAAKKKFDRAGVRKLIFKEYAKHKKNAGKMECTSSSRRTGNRGPRPSSR